MTYVLAAVVAGLAAVVPLLPPEWHAMNFAAFGAVTLFVAARGGRLGLPLACAIGLGAKLFSDFAAYTQRGYDADYLPMAVVYVGLAMYAIVGYVALRRTENPLILTGGTLVAGGLFFLITNFGAWYAMEAAYSRDFAGLMESYALGLPFHRPVVIGDLLFAGGLFGGHAVLSRAYFPAEKVASVGVPS